MTIRLSATRGKKHCYATTYERRQRSCWAPRFRRNQGARGEGHERRAVSTCRERKEEGLARMRCAIEETIAALADWSADSNQLDSQEVVATARALDIRLAAIRLLPGEEKYVADCVDACMPLVAALIDNRCVGGRRARKRPFSSNVERVEFVVRWLENFVIALRSGSQVARP